MNLPFQKNEQKLALPISVINATTINLYGFRKNSERYNFSDYLHDYLPD